MQSEQDARVRRQRSLRGRGGGGFSRGGRFANKQKPSRTAVSSGTLGLLIKSWGTVVTDLAQWTKWVTVLIRDYCNCLSQADLDREREDYMKKDANAKMTSSKHAKIAF